MSYILDALRRADSERERGSVPHLHANPVPADRADEEGAARRARPGLWMLAALALLVLGGLVSQWLWRDAGGSVVVAASQQPSTPGQTAALPPPMPPDAGAAVALPGPGIVRLEPPRTEPSFTGDQPVAAPKLPATAVPVVVAPSAAAAPVPLLKDLPEGLRRQLPALATGGAMYSDSAANRMLIINGQVYREGDKVAADLVLEKIKLNMAVLVFKGQRFSINY